MQLQELRNPHPCLERLKSTLLSYKSQGLGAICWWKTPDGHGYSSRSGEEREHPTYGASRRALEAALEEIGPPGRRGPPVSPWYRTAPIPASDQPWYVNAVAEVATDLAPDALLARLHEVEDAFGRVRTVPNAARLIDLDLLDFNGETAAEGPGRATLPHPRMEGRAFVLRPLTETWRRTGGIR